MISYRTIILFTSRESSWAKVGRKETAWIHEVFISYNCKGDGVYILSETLLLPSLWGSYKSTAIVRHQWNYWPHKLKVTKSWQGWGCVKDSKFCWITVIVSGAGHVRTCLKHEEEFLQAAVSGAEEKQLTTQNTARILLGWKVLGDLEIPISALEIRHMPYQKNRLQVRSGS